MSMITLFSAFMGLYVIVRLILPSGMNWPLKLILSLFALACAEKLLLTKLVYGTMGAFMPEPVQLASGYLHSAVTILFLLLVVRDALLLLTWPFRRSTGRQRKIFYGHKEKKPASGFWAFTLVLLALALSGYGMREALRVPPVREVRMQVPGLPDALNGFRIAQLSDLHIGPTFGKAWLTDVVARTDSLNPDLIVITGDLVNREDRDLSCALSLAAMAAQIAALWVIEWGVGGFGGFLLAMLLTMPIAALFGFLIGKLLNKMKGQEMIGGLILGYFANGLYQLLFLFIFGNLIPLNTPGLVIKGSTGVANTIDLTYGSGGGIKYALDGLWKLSFGPALYICCGVIAALLVVLMLTKRLNAKKGGISIGILAAACLLYQIPAVASLFSMVTVPMVTFLVVGLLCLFNVGIMKTRIGQQFRAVGQNRTVANASGIHVDHVRVIAIMISTVLAGWGQLIFVQNMGTFQTYGAHEQVGLYAGAAILVGGASIRRATNGQALLGCILFLLTLLLSIAVEMISARRPKTM